MSAPYFLAVDVRADATTAAVAVGSQIDAIHTSSALLNQHDGADGGASSLRRTSSSARRHSRAALLSRTG